MIILYNMSIQQLSSASDHLLQVSLLGIDQQHLDLCIYICMREESTSEIIKLPLNFETVGPDYLVTKLLILISTEVIAKVALYCCILL